MQAVSPSIPPVIVTLLNYRTTLDVPWAVIQMLITISLDARLLFTAQCKDSLLSKFLTEDSIMRNYIEF